MKKIMIVDDEQISLMMTNHILSTEYETICATSGEEAIELYLTEAPDMVLSDLRMPGMSGYELQQKLQALSSGSVPFMFMTADHDDETESKGFANGAMDFIRKPFRADILLKRVGNILQTVEQIQGLRKAAVTDPMTGLLNKASSQEEIGRICRNTPGTLMMIDLDNFKPVNDIYGHDMGDKVLIRFAEIIKSAIRSTDLAGRMGGDEFIAFCQHVNDESVIANKTAYINEQLLLSAKEFMGEDLSIPLGASVGCVQVPKEGIDFHTIYKKADQALYVVKQNGKHGYHFYKSSNQITSPAEDEKDSLSNAYRILSERSRTPGAYFLPFESFRTIYQFLKRITNNYPVYQKNIWFLLFTLNDTSENFDSVTEEFKAVLCSSLRQSDVATQSSRNQFMLLLFASQRSNIDLVVERIRHNWQNTESGSTCRLSYHIDAIQ